MKEGIIAIEPFASTGAGIVYEGSPNTLYALHQPKPVRSPSARQLLNFIAKEYQQFPFTTRWLVKEFGAGKTVIGLRELQMAGCLETHPPLLDEHHGIVSQSEHTIYVSDKVEVLTK